MVSSWMSTAVSHWKRQEMPKRSSTSPAQTCRADMRPWESETTGNRPRASSRVLWIASFTSFTILAASAASGNCFSAKLGFVHLGHERNAGKVLSEAVVQILADAALFTSADVEQRPLQLLALGDVDAGCNDVAGRTVAGRQHGAGPGDQAVRLYAA